MKAPRSWLPILLLLVLVGLAVWLAVCFLNRSPRGPELEDPPETVADTIVEAQVPRPPKGLGKLTRHPVKIRAQVSAGQPDSAAVRRWLRAVKLVDSLRRSNDSLRQRAAAGDTTAGGKIQPLPQVLAPGWGKYDGKRLTLGLTRSDGSVMVATAKVRPHFDWKTGLDDLTDSLPFIHEDRWWLRQARELGGCAWRSAPFAAGGAVVDEENPLRGAAIGAGVAVAACMLD